MCYRAALLISTVLLDIRASLIVIRPAVLDVRAALVAVILVTSAECVVIRATIRRYRSCTGLLQVL
jgi:hypothetical protein